GRATVALGVRWAACLAGPGCHVTVNYSLKGDPAPQENAPPKADGPPDDGPARQETLRTGPGGLVRTGFQPRTAEMGPDAEGRDGKSPARDGGDGKTEPAPAAAGAPPG